MQSRQLPRLRQQKHRRRLQRCQGSPAKARRHVQCAVCDEGGWPCPLSVASPTHPPLCHRFSAASTRDVDASLVRRYQNVGDMLQAALSALVATVTTVSTMAAEVPQLKNYINGAFVEPVSGEYIDDVSPATDAVISRIARSGEEDVTAAVEAAVAARSGEWASFSAARRAEMLNAVADKLEERLPELAAMESRDSGKTITMATNVDIPRAVANFRFFAGQIKHDETGCHQMADALNYTLRSPVGVVGIITPWNLPIYLLSWKVAPALAMGNTVVCKPSEVTPMTASALAEIIDEVGFPAGVFNLVHGLGAEAGAALVGAPGVNAVSFTGGTVTGAKVAAAASTTFKKLSLELGGKNSTIVFDDADLDKAVAGAVRAAFLNQGQVCLAGSRVLVQAGIYDTFVEKFVEQAAALKVGDPSDPDAFLGALVSKAHREKVESYVALAKEEGGTIAVGGKRPELGEPFDSGAFYTPTVVLDLPVTARCSTEEIFGPVVTIHKFDSEQEAIDAANGVRYGLAGSIWTRDLTTAHRVAGKIHTGMLWINCWLKRDLRVPFGGVKSSGTGREGGKFSMEFYSEVKNVCVYLGE
eukprot:PLAT11444.1.p1 GENE.PLAT11444.1~~PLAT11444.1.p1  ORF type:complete len:586 (-),score=215.02 PLAT11444.1:163-1920(-)